MFLQSCGTAITLLAIGLALGQTGCHRPVAKPNPENAVAKPKQVPITKRKTNVVVDYHKVIADNPNVFEVDNKITSKDPLSVALEGYNSAASDLGFIELQHNFDLVRATEDRILSHAEVQQYIIDNGMSMPALQDYQMYGYDDRTGRFMVLEDPDKKAAWRAERGLAPAPPGAAAEPPGIPPAEPATDDAAN